MHLPDQKILRLIDILIFEKRIKSIKEFCLEVGISETTVPKIKKGICHFTVSHIQTICKIYNVNANWIFDFDNQIFKNIKSNQKSVHTTLINQI